MAFWIILTLAVGAVQIKTAVRYRNYKEIAAFGILAAVAIALTLYVQRYPAQLSLASEILRWFGLE